MQKNPKILKGEIRGERNHFVIVMKKNHIRGQRGSFCKEEEKNW